MPRQLDSALPCAWSCREPCRHDNKPRRPHLCRQARIAADTGGSERDMRAHTQAPPKQIPSRSADRRAGSPGRCAIFVSLGSGSCSHYRGLPISATVSMSPIHWPACPSDNCDRPCSGREHRKSTRGAGQRPGGILIMAHYCVATTEGKPAK